MSGLPIVPLFEIKSYVVVLSLHIKMMKRRTLQACSLKHRIKKGFFSVYDQLDLFKLEIEESSPLHFLLRAWNRSTLKFFETYVSASEYVE